MSDLSAAGRIHTALAALQVPTLELDPPLAKSVHRTEVAAAQNFLLSAVESVENMLAAQRQQRTIRPAMTNGSESGRLSDADQDLLRAALLFAGAGCDAVLKQLVKDALPIVIGESGRALDRLARFAGNHLAPSDTDVTIDRRVLVELLISERPRDVLVEAYSAHLRSGSLQSTEKVGEIASCFAVDEEFYKRIKPESSLLTEAFRARNVVVHEMDLRRPDLGTVGANSHNQTYRRAQDIIKWSEEILSCTQFIVSSVDELLATTSAG